MYKLILFILIIWIIGAYTCSSEEESSNHPTIEMYIQRLNLSEEVEEIFQNPWTNK
jgi:hypothetical protein